MLTTRPTYQPNPNVVATELDESELVLLDLVTKRYYSLNETGGRIWQLLVEGRDVPGVIEQVTAEFEAEQSEVEQYVAAFLDELTAEGLLSVAAE